MKPKKFDARFNLRLTQSELSLLKVHSIKVEKSISEIIRETVINPLKNK